MTPGVLIGALLSLATPPAAPADGAATLVFSFAGLRGSGAVMLALYDSEAAYRKRSRPLRQARATVRGGVAEIRLNGLPPGAYAAMVFHDVNGDGKMNFSALKLPQEPYGVSNNAKGLPLAGWKAAMFRAGPGETRQRIGLK